MLFPHVLLQVPEEAKGRQLWALRALVVQQLSGRHQEPPVPLGTQRRHLEWALAWPLTPHPQRHPGSRSQGRQAFPPTPATALASEPDGAGLGVRSYAPPGPKSNEATGRGWVHNLGDCPLRQVDMMTSPHRDPPFTWKTWTILTKTVPLHGFSRHGPRTGFAGAHVYLRGRQKAGTVCCARSAFPDSPPATTSGGVLGASPVTSHLALMSVLHQAPPPS